MKIGIIQYDIVKNDIDINVQKIDRLINDTNADLYVAPELCLTGYLYNNKKELINIIENNNECFENIRKICEKKKCTMIFGHASYENKKLYNSAFLIDCNGIQGKYNKIHCSKIEKELFDEGDTIKVFKINNVKIGICICYDLWIPELSRIYLKMGAQIICSPSNFGGPWTLDVAKTRSMENKLYYIVSNRIGRESENGIEAHFRGESTIFNCYGDIILQENNQEVVKVVEIDENITLSKETIMSNDILLEAEKYICNIKKA